LKKTKKKSEDFELKINLLVCLPRLSNSFICIVEFVGYVCSITFNVLIKAIWINGSVESRIYCMNILENK